MQSENSVLCKIWGKVWKIGITTSFMSGSCHLDRATNVKIDVECQIFADICYCYLF